MASKKKEKESIVEPSHDDSKTVYTPSDKEQEVVRAVFAKFRNSADDRNRNFEYFDGSNLIEYINDSVRRFTTNVDEREDIEDWQARVHVPFTRTKVLALLGKVVNVLPMGQAKGRGDEDNRKADILNNLYEYAEEIDDYEELMVNILLEAIVKGTAIGYEGLESKAKVLKDVKKSGDNITFTKITETTNKLYGSIIPLEDFYPQHVGLRNVKMMDFCFWRSDMPHSKFESLFGGYAQSEFVQPQKTYSAKEIRPFYADFISNTVTEGNVEVIRYYNKAEDEYVIIANGIWLNPLNVNGVQEISPLPFNHKELPFWDIKFDIFGSDFFYGKSLPDRLKTLQDVLNVLENMSLDQSFLTIFPPLLTSGFDSFEDDYLRPGRRVPVDTQGLPLNQAFMKLDLGTPTGWHQFILEHTQKIMEQSSLDQVASGQAGVGGRTTAQEIRAAAESAASIIGIFGRSINYGIKRKFLLKSSNILQFWTDENTPMIKRVLGDGSIEGAKDAFNVYKINNTVLTSGKRGAKIIEFYKSEATKPSKDVLTSRALLHQAETGKKIEIMAVDPSYLRSFQFDISVVSNPKKEATKDIDKAMQLEKVKTLVSFFPNQIDMNELAAQTVEIMGDDPAKILKQDIINPPPPAPAGEAGSPAMPPESTQPSMSMSNNAIRGMSGGEGNSMQMRDLANSMQG